METQPRPDRLPDVLDLALLVLAVVHALAGAGAAALISFLFVALSESPGEDHDFVVWVCLLGLAYVVLCGFAAFSRHPVRRGWCAAAAAVVAILVLLGMVTDSGAPALLWFAPSVALLCCAAPAIAAPYRD